MSARIAVATGLVGFALALGLPAFGQEEDAAPQRKRADTWNPTQDEVTVQKGDTLWSLSERYAGSPFFWPRVWAYNPEVTNPHWIYPGDIIRFYPADVALPLLAELASTSREMPEEIVPKPAETRSQNVVEEVNTLSPRLVKRARVLASVFITEKELQESGTLTNAVDDKILLSRGDRVFATFPDDKAPSPGQRYMIYKTVTPVKHPKTGDRIGYVTQVTGFLSVESNEEDVSRGRVLDTLQEVERGQFLTPLVTMPVADMTVKPAKNRVSGVIAAVGDGTQRTAASPSFVFLDVGKSSGLEVGNKLNVFVRGDRYKERKDLPSTSIGAIMAVDVRDTVATCLVLGVREELLPGQAVQTIVNGSGG